MKVPMITKSGKKSDFTEKEKMDLLRQIFMEKPRDNYIVISVDGAGPRERGEYRLGGIGIVVTNCVDDAITYETHRFTYNSPNMTSVLAEILALHAGCQCAVELRSIWPDKKIIILTDNDFAAQVGNGIVTSSKDHLSQWCDEIGEYLQMIGEVKVVWFSRELNILADEASKVAAEEFELSITI